MRLLLFIYSIIFISNYWSPIVVANKIQTQASTDIAQEKDDRLLLFATLEGNLIAIEQQTGRIKWKIKDKPIVQVPVNTTNAIIPIYLPDPRDGSLYLLGDNGEPLKKLPFTIPQLVATSPCRSSDGILYTGKKKDSWFRLDPNTGNKEQILGWGEISSSTCPIANSGSVYLGRTKYSVMMVDSHNPQRKWNVTYYDYTAQIMTKDELNNYDLHHFASSSSGRLVTMDRRRGSALWDGDLGSPVVAAYILDDEGLLVAPFTTLANHTLAHLTSELALHDGVPLEGQPHKMKLYPTVYIGDHLYGLYAIPSFIDQSAVTISNSQNGPLLLGGPNAPDLPKRYPEYPIPGYNYHIPKSDSLTFQSIPNIGKNFIIFIGHYNVPKYSETRFLSPRIASKQIKLITDESIVVKNQAKIVNPNSNNNDNKNNYKDKHSIGIQVDKLQNKFDEIINEAVIKIKLTNSTLIERMENLIKTTKLWINQQDNKGLKLLLIILIGCVITMFWYLQMQVRGFQNMSQNSSRTSQNSKLDAFGRNDGITAYSEDLPDGLVRVGKITFHPGQLLGKGCEGTFVYRGEFDSRRVAVKRLLPECFTFADREVALLRESDAHPNVIRYYCMEQDRMFRYIALELCQATLSEYVQGRIDTNLIGPLEILKQATAGLGHLHSLDIVHRDIKPHNVLISIPDNRGNVKAMISDFGLCKKLQVGRVSFSRRSGVTGTDGWIAPEMLSNDDDERTTCAVDLFSLGCLYYYVLSNGNHPFGDALRRQANILNDEFNLCDLKGDLWEINLQKPLITSMISSKPTNRPGCNIILQHPIFWDNNKILAFFQDVSDRVEKEEMNDKVLKELEENSTAIVRGDWRVHIHEEVASDLRKYRSYRGQSVRDLLRALRNKKHHFRELTEKAQKYLGDIPDAFTKYWMSRFPLLLIHTWLTMQNVSNEATFQQYYPTNYIYSKQRFIEQIYDYLLENPIVIDPDILKNRNENEQMLLAKSLKKGSPFNDQNFRRRFNNNNYGNNNDFIKYSNEPKNVGLYRNLPSTSLSNNDPTTEWKIVGGNKKKKLPKSDEPLFWSINDNH